MELASESASTGLEILSLEPPCPIRRLERDWPKDQILAFHIVTEALYITGHAELIESLALRMHGETASADLEQFFAAVRMDQIVHSFLGDAETEPTIPRLSRK